MKNYLPCLLFSAFLLILLSCSKPNDNQTHSYRSLDSFHVTVMQRWPAWARIDWTEASNPYGTDSVYYDVVLRNRTVATGLRTLYDTLWNISPDSSYDGRVKAYTRSGDTVSAPFHIIDHHSCVYLGSWQFYEFSKSILGEGGSSTWTSNGESAGIPVVSNDTVFTTDKSGGVLAYSASTGAVLWRQPSANSGTPADFQHMTYAQGYLYGNTMGLHCIDSRTGAFRWSYRDSGIAFYTNPLVVADRVFVGTNSNGNYTYALEAATGKQIWKSEVYYGQLSPMPVSYKDLLIFCDGNNHLFARRQSDGTIAWDNDLNGVNSYGAMIFTTLSLYKDLVIVPTDRGIYAYHAATGSLAWVYNDLSSYVNITAVGGDRIYLIEGSTSLVALDAASGQRRWKVDNAGIETSWTNIAYAAENVFVTGKSKNLIRFDAATGRYIGWAAYGVDAQSFAVQIDGKVYYPSMSPNVQ